MTSTKKTAKKPAKKPAKKGAVRKRIAVAAKRLGLAKPGPLLDVDIGGAIRFLRLEHPKGETPKRGWYGYRDRYTIAEAAERIGVMRATLSAVERGKRSLLVRELGPWSAALGWTTADVLAQAERLRDAREGAK